MFETIALSLLKTLSSFLFQQYLDSTNEIYLDDAPSWYYQKESGQICSYSFVDGNYEKIDTLKFSISYQLEKNLKNINQMVFEERVLNVQPADREFIEKFKIDKDLHSFTKRNITFKKIVYVAEVNRTFGKGCISSKDVYEYNKKRVNGIVKELSLKHAKDSFSELEENEIKSSNSEIDRYFEELE
jgi:hypothetical protein